MSGVLLRCPKCGTTQSHTGECDACYEDTVRYYCSNHSPGLWLNAPTCIKCGAKFGAAPLKAPSPAPRASTPVVRPPRQQPVRRPAEPAAAPTRDAFEESPAPGVRWGRLPAADAEDAWMREPIPELRIPVSPLGGCLARFVKLALVLLAIFLVGSYVFVEGLLKLILGG